MKRSLALVAFILFSAPFLGFGQGCVGTQTFTINPPPSGSNTYAPGTVLTVCYSMDGYTQNGANWIGGFEVVVGPGFVPGSIVPGTPPATCDGSGGSWIWMNSVTGNTGAVHGTGFYFDRDNDGDAGNDFGDNSETCIWSFCFDITVGATMGADVSISIFALSDEEVGSWSGSGACPPENPVSVSTATIENPCGTVTASVVQDETCSGDADGEATGSMTNGTAPYTYSWNTVPIQTTQNATGLTAGTYTLSVTDASGCVETATVTINTGSAEDGTINNVNATNTLCMSDAPVQLTTVQAGGAFAGTGVGVTGVFDPAGAGAGVHTISYTTGGPCADTQTLDITVVQDADATITDPFNPNDPTNTLCINDAAVQLVTAMAGGTWAGPGVSATGLFDPMAAGVGTHMITYDIAPPCGDNDMIAITVSGASDATINNINATNELCESDAPVQLTTVDAGGTFSGTGVSATGLFDPALAGVGVSTITYTIAGNCPDVQTLDITVIQDADATINNVSPGNLVAIGDPAFQVTTVQLGGTFTGNGISATGIFDPAAAGPGTHTITYTLAGPCGDVQTLDITVVEITFTATGINLDCHQDLSGQILVTNETGAGPHQYSSDGGTTFGADNPITGLAAGTYQVVVMDNDGFVSEPVDVTLTEPTALTVTAIMDVQSDCGQANGEATATAVGGSAAANYSYSWDSAPIQLAATATGLLPQTYTVTATDDNGCQASTTVDITSTPQISMNLISATDPTCFAGCDGQAEVECTGTAVAPFNYVWDDPSAQTTANATGLCAGTYTVIGTDAVGCTASLSLAIGEPSEVQVTVSSSASPICIGGSSDLLAQTQGGNGPYNVLWTSTPVDGSLIDNVTNPTVSPTVSTDYTIVATDALGCTSTPIDITVEVYDALALDALRPMFSPDTGICPYDEAIIDLQATGGDGNYEYYQLPNITTPISFPIAVQPATTSLYEFMVLDGCTTPPAFLNSTITVFNLPEVDFMAENPEGCEPWLAEFTDLTSPAPASVLWNFGDSSSAENTSPVGNPSHIYGNDGIYPVTLTVTSLEGCVADTTLDSLITVYPLPVASFSATPEQTNLLQANIKMQDFSHDSIMNWSWDFGDGESSTDPEPWHVYNDSGTYVINLMVETVHGCSAYDEQTVIIEPDYMFYVPSAFSPNGDGDNDKFEVEGEGVFWDTFEMVIMNRWGNEVFHSGNKDFAWDGTYLGREAEVGVYTYKINFMNHLEEDQQYLGHVTLIR